MTTEPEYSGYLQWKGWAATHFGSFGRQEARYFAQEIENSGVKNLAKQRVVELGFGNGSFAAWATSQAANYAGIELQPELVEFGQRAGFEMYPAQTPLPEIFPENSVDCIVAFDVFEHIDIQQLAILLEQCARILRKDGIVVGRIPSGDSPFSGAIQHGDITHRSVLGTSALRQLAAGAGLRVEDVREPAFPLFGAGPATFFRRITVLTLRKMTNLFIAHVLMGNSGAVLTPNLVFTMRKSSQ